MGSLTQWVSQQAVLLITVPRRRRLHRRNSLRRLAQAPTMSWLHCESGGRRRQTLCSWPKFLVRVRIQTRSSALKAGPRLPLRVRLLAFPRVRSKPSLRRRARQTFGRRPRLTARSVLLPLCLQTCYGCHKLGQPLLWLPLIPSLPASRQKNNCPLRLCMIPWMRCARLWQAEMSMASMLSSRQACLALRLPVRRATHSLGTQLRCLTVAMMTSPPHLAFPLAQEAFPLQAPLP